RPNEWESLHKLLVSLRDKLGDGDNTNLADCWNQAVGEAGLPCRVQAGKSLTEGLCALLAKEPTLQRASELLSAAKFIEFRKLAKELFPQAPIEDACSGLKGLIAMASYAKETTDGYPLLPARYHFFVTGFEEATAC